jgi:hypothetical protein
LCQSKYGIFAGAQRLAALMNLLEINKVSYLVYEIMFHMEIFYEHKSPAEIFPKALNSICKGP